MRASPTVGDLKLCRPCSTWKLKTEFVKDARLKSGIASKCAVCNRKSASTHRKLNPGKNAQQVAAWRERNPGYTRDYYEANIERLRQRGVSGNRRRKYGISDEKYMEMWEAQGGLCYLCKNPETARYADGKVKMLSVDHCHKSGVVRRLLCHHCNTGLGSFKDDISLLKEAIKYLEDFK